jgi:hypothetical protein
MIGGGGGTTGIGAAGANPATTATTGSSTPFNVVQPSSYLNMFIKL